jgi:hypothetical protein
LSSLIPTHIHSNQSTFLRGGVEPIKACFDKKKDHFIKALWHPVKKPTFIILNSLNLYE